MSERKARPGSSMSLSICVWRWEDAPDCYRALSPHGGDEDWVALIPRAYLDRHGDSYVGWMDAGGPFGCCDVSEHATPDGIIRIGAHS